MKNLDIIFASQDENMRFYPIVFESSFSALKATLERYTESEDYFLVTDQAVGDLYLKEIETNLKPCATYILPPGEGSKNFSHYQNIIEHFLSAGIHRNAVIIALGGGVVGDMAGFVAATILRGVSYVQVPTTLLAQVDSSVGGKTGINTIYGKNLAGCFYQPRAVYMNLQCLQTLPMRERRAGYAEILKYALLGDSGFYDWLADHTDEILQAEAEALHFAVYKSCQMKADIVMADERESGRRALLNLGHTFGHALEAAAGYDGSLLHGEAVLLGMDIAFGYAVMQGICPDTEWQRLRHHYDRYDLWPDYTIKATAKDLLQSMQKDKKNMQGQITLILPKCIGACFIDKTQEKQDIKSYLEKHLKQFIR